MSYLFVIHYEDRKIQYRVKKKSKCSLCSILRSHSVLSGIQPSPCRETEFHPKSSTCSGQLPRWVGLWGWVYKLDEMVCVCVYTRRMFEMQHDQNYLPYTHLKRIEVSVSLRKTEATNILLLLQEQNKGFKSKRLAELPLNLISIITHNYARHY